MWQDRSRVCGKRYFPIWGHGGWKRPYRNLVLETIHTAQTWSIMFWVSWVLWNHYRVQPDLDYAVYFHNNNNIVPTLAVVMVFFVTRFVYSMDTVCFVAVWCGCLCTACLAHILWEFSGSTMMMVWMFHSLVVVVVCVVRVGNAEGVVHSAHALTDSKLCDQLRLHIIWCRSNIERFVISLHAQGNQIREWPLCCLNGQHLYSDYPKMSTKPIFRGKLLWASFL